MTTEEPHHIKELRSKAESLKADWLKERLALKPKENRWIDAERELEEALYRAGLFYTVHLTSYGVDHAEEPFFDIDEAVGHSDWGEDYGNFDVNRITYGPERTEVSEEDLTDARKRVHGDKWNLYVH